MSDKNIQCDMCRNYYKPKGINRHKKYCSVKNKQREVFDEISSSKDKIILPDILVAEICRYLSSVSELRIFSSVSKCYYNSVTSYFRDEIRKYNLTTRMMTRMHKIRVLSYEQLSCMKLRICVLCRENFNGNVDEYWECYAHPLCVRKCLINTYYLKDLNVLEEDVKHLPTQSLTGFSNRNNYEYDVVWKDKNDSVIPYEETLEHVLKNKAMIIRKRIEDKERVEKERQQTEERECFRKEQNKIKLLEKRQLNLKARIGKISQAELRKCRSFIGKYIKKNEGIFFGDYFELKIKPLENITNVRRTISFLKDVDETIPENLKCFLNHVENQTWNLKDINIVLEYCERELSIREIQKMKKEDKNTKMKRQDKNTKINFQSQHICFCGKLGSKYCITKFCRYCCRDDSCFHR